MRIYVDAAVHRWRGKLWCHLFTPDLAYLHHFAAELGMKANWFQDPASGKVSWPHFDLPSWRRQIALDMGAIALDRHQTVAMSKVVLNTFDGVHGTLQARDPFETHRRLGSSRLPELQGWLAQELELLGLACRQAA